MDLASNAKAIVAALSTASAISVDKQNALVQVLRKDGNLSTVAKSIEKAQIKLPKSTLLKLPLLQRLLDISNNNVNLALKIISLESLIDLKSVAVAHSDPTASLKFSMSENDLVLWQRNLFTYEPTAVLACLVRSDSLNSTLSTRSAIRDVFQVALDTGFNITQESVRELQTKSTQLSSETIDLALPVLRTLQRLQAIVTSIRDVSILYNNGYYSANMIAILPQDDFVKKQELQRLSQSTLRQIHSNATMVTVRNQHAWAGLLAQRTTELLPAIRLKSVGSGPPSAYTNPTYTSMFGETDSFECADCESVFSPAAYLADLLQTLNLLIVNPPNDDEETGVRSKSTTLLDMLTRRRPDLLDIELSCYNTNTRIPYIDISLEVMESFLTKKYNLNALVAADDSAVDDKLNQNGIRTSQFPLYQTLLASKKFPLDSFPYNLGTHAVRAILRTYGTSLLDVMRIFASEYRSLPIELMSDEGDPRSIDALKAARDVSLTMQACEVLGLQEEDYIYLARETHASFSFQRFINSSSASMSLEEYQSNVVKYTGCAEYWGFANTNEMVAGLTIIQQVLDRGNIAFDELIDILKTNFIGGRLIITSVDGCQGLRQSMAELRLRSSVLVSADGILTEAVCDDLQIFLRLRKKLDMSISDLDAILTSLDQYRLIQPSGLSRRMVRELAAVFQLRKISSRLSLGELCCLWGETNLCDVKNAISRALLRLALTKKDQIDQILTPFNNNNLKIPVSPQLGAILRLSTSEWSFLLRYTESSNAGDLNLSQVLQIYRLGVFARLIDVKVTEVPIVAKALSGDLRKDIVFESPSSVLQACGRWKTLLSRGFTPDLFIKLGDVNSLSTSSGISEPTNIKSLSFLRRIANLPSTTSLFNHSIEAFIDAYPKIDPITVRSSVMNVNLQQILEERGQLKDMKAASTAANWRGYVFPTSVRPSRFVFEAQSSTTLFLFVDGEAVDVQKVPTQEQQDQKEANQKYFALIQFKTIAWHTFDLSTIPQKVLWTSESSEIFSGTLFCHRDVLQAYSGLLKLFDLASLLFDSCPLNDDELNSMGCILLGNASSGAGSGCKLAPLFTKTAFDFGMLSPLSEYKVLRDSIPEDCKSFLLQFLSDDLPDGMTIATILAKITGLTEPQANEVLTNKFPAMGEDMLGSLLRQPEQLLKLKYIGEFLSKVDIPGAGVEDLFKLAQPFMSVGDIFTSAKRLVNGSASSTEQADGTRIESVKAASQSLRDSRRSALLAYLLYHTDLPQTEELIDADSLYEFFLVDVNSGPVPETSRISHAISVVQLFMQRCFLGLEAKRGVSIAIVNGLREKWVVDGKYTTWEANRKVFLFPENWILPSLRDTKTEQFKAFEGALMQNDLNELNINTAIKNYVYSVNRLAFLDVQAYLWDQGPGGSGFFHFFARTRSEPHQFFYRSLQIKWLAKERLCYWNPWESIDIELPNQTVDKDGEKSKSNGCYLIPALVEGRLFLFAPEIAFKSKPIAQGNASFVSMANVAGSANPDNSVKSRWEIRMAWTERRGQKWSPRSVSNDAVVVDTACLSVLPSLESFRFRIRSRAPTGGADPSPIKLPKIVSEKEKKNEEEKKEREGGVPESESTTSLNVGIQDILVIDVECWQDEANPKPIHLGQFEMRDSHIGVSTFTPSSLGKLTNPKTLPTKFAKLTLDVTAAKPANMPTYTVIERQAIEDKEGAVAVDLEVEPLLADVHNEDEVKKHQEKQIAWTLVSDDTQCSRPLGLVVDITSRAHGPKSYFALPPAKPIEPYVKSVDLTSKVDVYPLHHRQSNATVSAATMNDGVSAVYQCLRESGDDPFGFGLHGENVFQESFDASSIYNWELGVHILMTVIERLQATQQFELALQYLNLVFDPTVDGSDSTKCWLFPPFKSKAMNASQPMIDVLSNLKKGAQAPTSFIDLAVVEWRANPFNAHGVARGRPSVYMKRIVIKYIEILVAAGDIHFRKNTMESIPLAMQRYIEALHVFGRMRRTSKAIASGTARSYSKLRAVLDLFSNASLDLEVEFPYSCLQRGMAMNENSKAGTKKPGLPGILSTMYFRVPQNPQMVTLSGLIDDRIAKIRNCQDINGQRSILPLFEPPIDPSILVQAYGSPSTHGKPSRPEPELALPNYRFTYLVQRALDITSEFRSMTELYLTAREKGDAEDFSLLKAQQEKVIADMNIAARILQKEEAERTLEVLNDNVKSSESRLRYYLQLIGEKSRAMPNIGESWLDIQQSIPDPSQDELKMSPEETLEFTKANEAADLTWRATILETTVGVLSALPNFTTMGQPMGVGAAIKIDPENAAKALSATATVLNLKAQLAGDESARASRKAQLIRQLQERRLQANITGREVVNLQKQISAQKTRIFITEAEIKSAQESFHQAIATEAWYKSKFTNRQLYTWLENSTQTLNYELYNMAIDLARRAEQALRWEQGNPSIAPIIDAKGYWNGSYNGLMSAQSLQLALKKLELANMDSPIQEYELTKNISLRQLNPNELVRLRAQGQAQFSLPEVLFDLDFPGHYFRRIKSIAVSVPCVTGPYTSINATLDLDESKYRHSSIAKIGSYAATDRDDRFTTITPATKSVALTERMSATGTFELSFSNERYVPFENAGAISKWNLQLPPPSIAQFDYGTISDVIIHLKYTARSGGQNLSNAAIDAIKTFRSSTGSTGNTDGLFALIDLKADCSNEWRAACRNSTGSDQLSVSIEDVRRFLPFWSQGSTVLIGSIVVAMKRKPEYVSVDKASDTSGMTVKASEGGADPVNLVFSKTFLTQTADAGEAKKWEFYMGGPLNKGPENLSLHFTSTIVPARKLDLNMYEQTLFLVRFTL